VIGSHKSLLSVTDTYADHGDPDERRTATIITTAMGWEKFARTSMRFTTPAELTEDEIHNLKRQTNTKYGPGFGAGGDMPRNLFRRLSRNIENPVLKDVFLALMWWLLKGMKSSTPIDLNKMEYKTYIKHYERMFIKPYEELKREFRHALRTFRTSTHT
jgi:hypothetical protein